jgi:tRNA threonylcarbamoyladenosine biosynthesis protein TsaE
MHSPPQFRKSNVSRLDFVTHSAEETLARGRELTGSIRAPLLLLLSGELGAGKTTLAKGIISGLGVAHEEQITSPSFTLVHQFSGAVKVYHVDLYRIEGFHDLETLGLEDLFAEPAIVLVEWPQKLTFETGWPSVRISLSHEGEEVRRIRIEDRGGVLCPLSGS